MKTFDVVVVGAGPGGSAFARTAAKNGLSVVVLEKRQAVGEPVRCGEAIGWSDLKNFKIKPNGRLCPQAVKSTLFVSPSGKSHTVKFSTDDGHIVERIAFDKELASVAASAGAKIMTRTRATGIKRKGKKIIVSAKRFGKKLEFECSLVVAADGIESRVAKWFGVETNYPPNELATCAQVELAGLRLKKPSQVEIHIGSVCPKGYVWVFPKGPDRANVGLGLPVSLADKSAEEYLEEFLKKDKRFAESSVIRDSCGIINVSLPLKEFTADNLMIVGTAARQVSSVDGGGMGFAIAAGELAAEIATEASRRKDFSKGVLSKYTKEWYKREGTHVKNMYKARQAFSDLSDSELDYVVENMNELDVNSIQAGKGFGKAIKFFMKKPSLVRIVRHLF